MVKSKLFRFILFVLPLFFITGCSIKSNEAFFIPNSDNVKMQRIYVIHSFADNRNLDEQIKDNLKKRGYLVFSGTKESMPKAIDVVVTYEDRWMWDLGNYMIKLSVQFRNAQNDYPFVAGEVVRTSLIRKDTKFMVNEVITKILEKMKERKNETNL